MGCDTSGSMDEETEPSVDALFQAPTNAEVQAVASEWASRDVSAQGGRVQMRDTVTVAGTSLRVRVLEHPVADGDGGAVQHVGALIVPEGAAPGSLPALVYAHGGDGGADLDDTLDLLPLLFASAPERLGQFAFVIPAFRDEPLTYAGTTYESEGPASPWDRDVDDALALLNESIAAEPAIDADRLGVLGFSRGAGVALLMGIRDPRLREIVAFFGPTDFYGEYVRSIVEDVVNDAPRDLPGVDVLTERFIQPWADGDLPTDAVRPELTRRSAVLYADRLPNVQIHHGTNDAVVDVSQARSMIDAMDALGRDTTTTPRFRAELYEGGGHNPVTLDDGDLSNGVESLRIANEALDRLLPVPARTAHTTPSLPAANLPPPSHSW